MHCKWILHQNSMALAQKQKHRSMEQDRKLRDKHKYLWPINLQPRRQDYTMKKRVFSIKSAEKTRQLQVEE